MTSAHWTPAEDAIMAEHYPVLGGSRLHASGRLPGRTLKAIYYRAMLLGLATREPLRPWTEAEQRRLRHFYADTSTAELARVLGRTEAAIGNQAALMGLRKTQAYMQAAGGRFQPGLVPWNKDKHVPARGRAVETQFKPGNRPHTWRPIGSERIADGVLQRKMTDTGCTRRDWVPVHRLLWEAHNGPVPKGHIVVFRNGDRTDIRLENLELITRRENMARNTVHRLPRELKKTIRAKAVLTRLIHQKDRSSSP